MKQDSGKVTQINAVDSVEAEVLIGNTQVDSLSADHVGPLSKDGPQAVFGGYRMSIRIQSKRGTGTGGSQRQDRECLPDRLIQWTELGFGIVFEVCVMVRVR